MVMPVSTHPSLPAFLLCLVASLSAAEKTEGPVSILNGEAISLSDHLVPGKTVVFGFVSDYSPPCPCEPCLALGDPLKALHVGRDDVVVVKVDVNREGVTKVDWDSPVMRKFGLRRLPHFVVFGPDGKMVAEDNIRTTDSAGRDMVHEMLVALPRHQPRVAKGS